MDTLNEGKSLHDTFEGQETLHQTKDNGQEHEMNESKYLRFLCSGLNIL